MSRLDTAQKVSDLCDDYDLLSRFNDYCDFCNPDNHVYPNIRRYISTFPKEQISASPQYRRHDNFFCSTSNGLKSAKNIRDLIDDDKTYKMNVLFLLNDDQMLNQIYSNYLDTLVEDNNTSIQEWVENLIFYHDEDKESQDFGINSFQLIMKKFIENFFIICHHSSQKTIKTATKIINDRTDIFPDDFIEKNL